MPDATTTVCPDCREMATNRAWVLRALGHPDCVAAIRAERTAASKFWIRINPQGCVEGSALGEVRAALGEQHLPQGRDRRREAAEGYRHELIGHDEWKQRAEPCLLGDCQHRQESAS